MRWAYRGQNDEILRGGQIAHGAIPESPPCLNFTVELWVVTAGGCAMRASDGGNRGHEFAEELGSVISQSAGHQGSRVESGVRREGEVPGWWLGGRVEELAEQS